MARKILLADDSVTAQNMGRKILSDAGYEVITVNNGSAALKKISEARPDVIVLDVYMPGYSGLEVCQRLKETAETSRMPVLLTVGKLEPFKPEEAKRVRADAFIVKPFEASELLSALSKLEDRIVPRAEPSKPGRFARAIAAVEEASRTEAVNDDPDTGWKNRISFPSKNKKKVEEDKDEEPQDFAPTKRETHAPPAPVAVDAPALPKDVTPEELAELAAAVAQVQAKQSAGTVEHSSQAAAQAQQAVQPEVAKAQEIVEAKVEPPVVADLPIDTSTAHAPVVTFGDARAEEEYRAELQREQARQKEARHNEAQREIAAQAKAFEKVSLKAEEKSATGTVAQFEAPKADETSGARIQEAARLEEARLEEKLAEVKDKDAKSASANVVEASSEKPGETLAAMPAEAARISEQTASADLPNHADMIAAIASLEPANGQGWDASLASPPTPTQQSADVPVTMAVAAAAGAGSSSTHAHWTAVPVALDRDEISLSLEREMEKAYAAMVAAESVPAAAATPAAEPQLEIKTEPQPEPASVAATSQPVSVASAPVESLQVEQAVVPAASEPVASASSTTREIAPHESMLAHALSAVAHAVKEVVGMVSPEAASSQESAVVAETKTETEAKTEETKIGEKKLEEKKNEESKAELANAEPEQASGAGAAVESAPEISQPAATAQASSAVESVASPVEQSPVEANSIQASEVQPVAETKSESAPEPQPVAAIAETSDNTESEPQPAAATAPPAAESSAVRGNSPAGGLDMADKESLAAAAWASWRQIRDTQKPGVANSSKSKQQDDDEDEYPAPAAEPAAMAAAAGAEKAPEETPDKASNPDAIASIVDSVLADLRPKIVAEISKKLNEKK